MLQAIVDILIPSPRRDDVSELLCERYQSPGQYVLDASQTIPGIVRNQIRRVFSLKHVLGQACILYICFSAAPQTLSLFIALAVALCVLLVRDGYSTGTPDAVAVDALATIGIVVLAQDMLQVFGSGLVLPWPDLLRGSGFTLLTVSMWRMVFLRAPAPAQPEAPLSPAEEMYAMTWRMNAAWIVGITAILGTNDHVMPWMNSHHTLDTLLIFATYTCLTMAYRGQKNALERSVRVDGTLFDRRIRELEQMRDNLWGEGTNEEGRVTWYLMSEILAFVLLGLLPFVSIAAWTAGFLSSSQVDWRQAVANGFAFLTLSGLWIYIRKANHAAALTIQAEIVRLKAEERQK